MLAIAYIFTLASELHTTTIGYSQIQVVEDFSCCWSCWSIDSIWFGLMVVDYKLLFLHSVRLLHLTTTSLAARWCWLVFVCITVLKCMCINCILVFATFGFISCVYWWSKDGLELFSVFRFDLSFFSHIFMCKTFTVLGRFIWKSNCRLLIEILLIIVSYRTFSKI